MSYSIVICPRIFFQISTIGCYGGRLAQQKNYRRGMLSLARRKAAGERQKWLECHTPHSFEYLLRFAHCVILRG